MTYEYYLLLVGVTVLVLLVGTMIYSEAQGAQADFYVATNGDDAWSGRLPDPNAVGTDGPFATLTRARDAIRQLKTADGLTAPVTVMVRGGTYYIHEPFILSPEDSGTEDCPITYMAYPGGKPVFSGGKEITGWQRGEGQLWVAEIPEVKTGQWYFRQLFANGQRRRRARLPNKDFYRVAELLPPETWEDSRRRAAFKFHSGDIKQWDDLDDAEVILLRSWDESRLRITEVDTEASTVIFTTPGEAVFRWVEEHARYYVENVRAGLDCPGEWYLDRKSGVVYYWPLADEDMTAAQVIAPFAQQLVRFEGDVDAREFVQHITLRGFTLCYSDWTLPAEGYPGYQAECYLSATVYAEGTRACAVHDCEITHIGKYGIWLARGCQGNQIVANSIHDIGAGGIKIGETTIPERDEEQTSGNILTDNYIYDGGQVFLCGVGVLVLQSSGNLVSHNEIHHLNYTGISVGWIWGYEPSPACDNIIEYNHIHTIGRGLLSDMGGIYTLGVSPGTVLRYNLIHDVDSYSYGGWGLYTDEGSSNILLENNVVYNTKTGGFHQHYGRENIVRNNILAFSRESQIQRTREEEHLSFTLERNIVYCDNGQLLGSNWGNGNYRLDYNLYWDASSRDIQFAGLSLSEWQAQGRDTHSIIADPLFVDPDNGDFTLPPESPAFKLGFKPIDLSGVGPRPRGQRL